jgi:hypothetical protein
MIEGVTIHDNSRETMLLAIVSRINSNGGGWSEMISDKGVGMAVAGIAASARGDGALVIQFTGDFIPTVEGNLESFKMYDNAMSPLLEIPHRYSLVGRDNAFYGEQKRLFLGMQLSVDPIAIFLWGK